MFGNIVPSRPAKKSTLEQVRDLEKALATTFPTGYEQYVTKLGRGYLADFVIIFTPEEILDSEDCTQSFREKLQNDGWRWEEDHPLASESEYLVLLGYTRSGDLIVFHPDEVDEIYSLSEENQYVELLSTQGLPVALETLLQDSDTDTTWEFEPREIAKSISTSNTIVPQ